MAESIFPKIKKGSILRIVHNNTIAIDRKNPSLFSDYILSITKLSKLNVSSNNRFYINVLIDTNYLLMYIDSFISINTLVNETSNKFNLTAKFIDTDIELDRIFSITECKFRKI